MKHLLMLAVSLSISAAAMSQTVSETKSETKTEAKCEPKAGCAKAGSCCSAGNTNKSEATPANSAAVATEKKSRKSAAATKEN